MKKLFSIVAFLTCFISISFAELSFSGENIESSNNVYIFKTLTGASVAYTDFEPKNFVWKSYTTNPSTAEIILSESNVTSSELITLQDATGYILEINGVQTEQFYVFDYSQHKAIINSVSVPVNDCDETQLTFNVTFEPMTYYLAGNVPLTVTRTALLSYNTLEKDEAAGELKEIEEEVSINVVNGNNSNYIATNVYAENTTFTLYSDQFAAEFELPECKATEEIQAAKAMVLAIGDLTPRDVDNEYEKDENPGSKRDLKGSAPVDVTFSSAVNSSGGYYTWDIYDQAEMGIYVGHSTEDGFQYAFNSAGVYTARLKYTALGQGCVDVDSIKITVVESAIDAPNVFTPNGDGANDEFRVSYKSIVKFEMWVYNRWGRLVYHSTNPARGWDGDIGNSKAAVGAYFYYIEATGADKETYKLKGDINLLR